ncbi:Kelch repeat-containing protein [Thiolapillus brandeum]|uniref:SLH domain-containing protein n=1 Tax=Thiolapillus brandeum TaxID=1076588 RepID=A0A7U6GI45_9GAMM|nr:S-layer homology domain-containing protein [Thiolapillus brandeum]BAO44071.1 hypothetical protein TBH_C1143 [Thiolapillus brandeum]
MRYISSDSTKNQAASCWRWLMIGLLILIGSGPLAAGQFHTTTFTLEQRVSCQSRIEDVRWSHSIWPESNTQPKPSRMEVMDEAQIRAQVEDNLRLEAALAGRYGIAITQSMLQSEINRMGSNSRIPDRLQELFKALDNDPLKVAECLARPLLVKRLLRERYEWDAHEHSDLRMTAKASAKQLQDPADFKGHIIELALTGEKEQTAQENTLHGGLIEMDKTGFQREATRLSRASSTPGLHETPTTFVYEKVLQKSPTRIRLIRQVWKKRSFDAWWKTEVSNWSLAKSKQSATDFTLPVIGISGKHASATWNPQAMLTADSWRVPDYPTERYRHSAVWTGSEMIIWGGQQDTYLNTGSRYDPVTDTWSATALAGAPSPRLNHTAIWTGSEMIIWGGYDATPYIAGPMPTTNETPTPLKAVGDGARYNPLTNTWTPMASSPQALTSHTAVWTGSLMLVWGGREPGGDATDKGGRYNPSSDTWTGISLSGAPTPRNDHTAVWTGSEMIIFGGEDSAFNTLHNGRRYNPGSDTWSAMTDATISLSNHTAVWTGSHMIIWGGSDGISTTNQGRIYNPSNNTWTETTITGAPVARVSHTAVWTGDKMIIWGGSGTNVNSSGGIYDPATDQWSATSTVNAPAARSVYTVVWTGSEMIIWGGWELAKDYPSRTGGRYDPASDSWQATASKWGPAGRTGHSAVWTGNEMIIWGGAEWNQLDSGGRYDPVTDNWLATSLTDGPAARQEHTGIWTGTEMLIWGGYNWNGSANYYQDGGRYNPATDSWQTLAPTNAPSGRNLHTAVWTGNEMIIWGGWDGSNYLADGGRYDPATDSWSGMIPGTLAARVHHTAVWTGNRMLVWGGYYYDTDNVYLQTGAQYDPTADSWTPISNTDAPSPRAYHSAVWAGQGMIVWGGLFVDGSNHYYLRSGGRYNAATNTWLAMATNNAPEGRSQHSAIWADDQGEMIVWGGEKSNTLGDLTNTGGRYNPVSNSWTATSTQAGPGPRKLISAVWTGREMIIWGGLDGSYTPQRSMGIYYPYASYLLGGTLTGLAPGTSVVLQNNQGDNLSLSTNGSFVFDTDLVNGSDYAVTVLSQPASPKKICSVSSGDGTINGADVSDIMVSCVDLFADVGVDHWAYDWIQALGAAGITQGCGSGNYCPASNVSRAEMAVFLERGMNGGTYTPPAASGGVFTDVPVSYWAADWVEQLASDGITSGCGGGNYCPDNDVTRAEMAVFLLRSEHGASYTPPPATGTAFDDVPTTHWAAGWIEQLASEDVTQGCGANNYCPDAQVTRAEMAVFLVRVFNL